MPRAQISEAPVASAAPSAKPAPAAATATGHAPLAVAIVVDQFAAWIAAERLPHLPNGGFARLRREGTWVQDCTYAHAGTETAPGHASLYTGRTPREHGIVANGAFRADLGRIGSLLEDPSTHLVGPSGQIPGNGISLGRLQAKPIADALLDRDPQSIVVALSIKDRGAAFAGGHHPTASLWLDPKTGVLVTSTAFAAPVSGPGLAGEPGAPDAGDGGGSLPVWAKPFARPLASHTELRWDLVDRAFVEAHAAMPDDQPGENERVLGGRVFPHRFTLGPDVASSVEAFRATPHADAFLADLALAAVDAARRPDHPMLLAISFSPNDYVGHNFGPDSWEAWEELLELDATLGRLFSGLDARVGPLGYSVVLSGDHGVSPMPEALAKGAMGAAKGSERGASDSPKARLVPRWCQQGFENAYGKACSAGVRIHDDDLKTAAEDEIRRALRPSRTEPMIRAISDGLVYLTQEARALDAESKRILDKAIRKRLALEPGVATVFAVEELGPSCPPMNDDSVRALVCRSTQSGVGDYYIVPKPGSFFWGASSAVQTGTSHGTPYRYDRTVPLLVRYPLPQKPAAASSGRAGSPGGGRWMAATGFGSFYASLWFALTGEKVDGAYGGVVGIESPEQGSSSKE